MKSKGISKSRGKYSSKVAPSTSKRDKNSSEPSKGSKIRSALSQAKDKLVPKKFIDIEQMLEESDDDEKILEKININNSLQRIDEEDEDGDGEGITKSKSKKQRNIAPRISKNKESQGIKDSQKKPDRFKTRKMDGNIRNLNKRSNVNRAETK